MKLLICELNVLKNNPDKEILLNEFQLLKENGLDIYLATNADNAYAQEFLDHLEENQKDCFKSFITATSHTSMGSILYWPRLKEKMGISCDEMAFLHNKPLYLELSSLYGVIGINSNNGTSVILKSLNALNNPT